MSKVNGQVYVYIATMSFDGRIRARVFGNKEGMDKYCREHEEEGTAITLHADPYPVIGSAHLLEDAEE